MYCCYFCSNSNTNRLKFFQELVTLDYKACFFQQRVPIDPVSFQVDNFFENSH